MMFYVVLSCLMVLPAGAAEYIVTPSITARETYDDNVFYYDVEDFEHLVSPALDLEARTERWKVQASLNGDISEYQSHSELNTVDQSHQISADIFTTATSQIGVSGSYLRDYTFTSALEELGVIAERSIRTATQIQPNARIELDPRNSLECFYRLNKTQYRLGTYPDNRNQDLNIIYIHKLKNELTSLSLQLGGSQADYTIGNETGKHQGLQILAGIDHPVSETFKLTLKAGARFTESDFPGIDMQRDETVVISSGFLWSFERTTVSANITRDSSSSIYGEDVTRDRISAALRYRIKENLNCALTAAYNQSETEGFYQKEKNRYYSVMPSVDYRFNEYVSMQLGCSYNKTENKITNQSEDRNRVFVQISTVYPLHY
ncbi:MAG: outer membrane beta-barrel protein [Desulfobacteraceae bacterium]|nr:outer membrane beta-barrel protein [Desulfobacteraceae bacterium]